MATPPSEIPSPLPASGSPSPSRSPNLKSSSPKSASPKSASPTLPMPLIVQHSADSNAKQDLRHMTSIGGIAEVRRDTTHPGSRRVSAHLQTGVRVGSKSPSSIPSSPTSVHSSSSAIFERDIEPLVSISPLIHHNPVQTHHPHSHSPTNRPQSLSPSSSHQQQPATVSTASPHSNPASTSSTGSTQPQSLHTLSHSHQVNPHRIPRAQTTAAIEQAVPSVLDSAAEILAGLQDTSGPEGDRIEVEAPVSSHSGQRSPYTSGLSGTGFAVFGGGGGRGSRSPSPGGMNRTSGSLLFNGSGSGGVSPSTSPTVSPSPITATMRPAPKISTSALDPTSSSSSPSTALPPAQPPNTAISPYSTSFASAPPLERIDSVGSTGGEQPSPMVTATPTSTYFSIASNSRENSRAGTPPADAGREVHLNEDEGAETLTATTTTVPQPTSQASQPTSQTSSPGLSPSTSPSQSQYLSQAQTQAQPQVRLRDPSTLPSHQHSSAHTQAKRLSFLSYADLLSSTPVSTLPLSSFTKGDEPPHLTMNNTVGDALALGTSSASGSPSPPYSASPLISPVSLAAPPSASGSAAGASPSRSATGPGNGSRTPSMRSGTANRDSLIMLEDLVGGEWEREGLGRGLEERLEGLLGKA